MAVNAVAGSLAGSATSTYMADDDPILVGEALPFSLKLMEAILEETPEHEGLLIAAASGFVQYGHAYVLRPAEMMEATDLDAARVARMRAGRLFLRALGYAGRALEVAHPGIIDQLDSTPESAVNRLEADDVAGLYWYAVALASAISADRGNMALVADLPLVHLLLSRSLELDEAWNKGAIHEAMIALVLERSKAEGGGAASAELHFRRAMELNGGRSISPMVLFAETVCVQQQDRRQFESLLNEALAFDARADTEFRLANLLAQQRAAWLLSRIDELFFQHRAPMVKEGSAAK
jgi:predicted anti-sigma-YlaC factor YlaD